MKRFLLLSWFVSGVGFAYHPACRFEVFRPPLLLQDLRESLPDLGIGEWRDATDIKYISRGLLAAKARLFHGDRVGFSDLTVYDGRDAVIFRAVERVFPCPAHDPVGRCHEIQFFNELDASGGKVPFALRVPPGGGLEHYRFEKRVGAYDWHGEFLDTFEWLRRTIAEAREARPIATPTEKDRLFVALVSDPYVAPYTERISFASAGGKLVISGVVPSNFVYGRVIDRAREAGFWHLDVRLIIDTGSARPLFIDPLLYKCARG